MDNRRRKSQKNPHSDQSTRNSEATIQKNWYTCGYLQLPRSKIHLQRPFDLPKPRRNKKPTVRAHKIRYTVPETITPGFKLAL